MFKEKSSVLDYFRKKPDPKELVRKWQADLRAQQRALERQIREIERDRKTAEKQVRDAAKRNDIASAKLLAKEIVHTKKVQGPLSCVLLKTGTTTTLPLAEVLSLPVAITEGKAY